MLNALLIEQPFMAKCYSNCDQIVEEWYAWFPEKRDSTTQGERNTEEISPPWITPGTSNLMNRLSTAEKVYQKQPNSISKGNRYNPKKKKEIDIAIAEDLAAYQEKVFASENGSLMFEHFR